jgi:hypothetical protein
VPFEFGILVTGICRNLLDDERDVMENARIAARLKRAEPGGWR